MLASQRRASGNTMMLLLAAFAAIIFLVGLLVLSYNQFFGVHKEATTAIDAAALQAAKDMSQITVDGPLGKLALVDDPAPAASNNYPVLGVNTVVATLRLDALIATQLDNKNMLYLVNQDLVRAVDAVNQLRQSIQAASTGSNAYDRNGNILNMKSNAQTVYNNNPIRQGFKRTTSAPAQIALSLGRLNLDTNSRKTNIPTPNQPGSGATDPDINGNNSYINNGMRFYMSDADIAIPGLTGKSIRLLALPDSVSLAQSSLFQPVSASNAGSNLATAMSQLPTCVQVTGDESVATIGQARIEPGKVHSLHIVATASAGGQRLTAATGTLAVNFPQGFPANPTNASSDSTPLTFNSVKSIMNAVQLTDPTVVQPTVDATDESNTWNGGSKGVWLKASGDKFPSSGSLQKQNFKNLEGREFDNPSVSLSFMVYDWLRSCGLRPNPKSVVDSLSFDLKTYVNSGGQPKRFLAHPGFDILQPAYATDAPTEGILTALLRLNDGNGDPRDLTRWDKDPAAYSRQEARMWGYMPADSVLPSESSVALLRPDGDVTTTDGNPLRDLIDMQNAIVVTNNHAYETNINVTKALVKIANQKLGTNISIEHPETLSESVRQKLESPEGKKLEQELAKNHPGLDAAWRNTRYCMQVTMAMKNNLKTLTGGGVKKISDKHFIVMGTDFYPATKSASEAAILSNHADTGQDTSSPVHDWCAPLKPGKEEPVSQLVFFKRTEAPVIGQRYGHPGWIPPALAQGSIPANNMLKFFFHLGDPNTPDASIVYMHPSPNSPFANVPTGNKQAEYQCSQAIKVASTSDPNTKVTWQVRARDQHCNHYPSPTGQESSPNPNSAAKHFTAFARPKADKQQAIHFIPAAEAADYDKNWCSPDNNQGCQALAAEWAMTCPVIENPPPPPLTPKPTPPAWSPPPWSPPPPPPCWATTYQVIGPGAFTIWAFLWLPCRTYNGCGQLISATHS